VNCHHLEIEKVKGDAKVEEIKSGIFRYDCTSEDNFVWHPTSEFNVILSKTGKRFGNCLYDGHWEQFYFVSESVMNVLLKYQPNLVYYSVNINEPIPIQYKDLYHEKYFSLDYRKLNVVNYDLTKYPYKNAWTCPECNSTREDTDEFFDDIINNTVKPRPFNLGDYKGDNLFRIECFGLACSDILKNELQQKFKKSFKFSKILFNE
jgi:hypothetical protein